MKSKAIDSALLITTITALLYGASAATVNSYLRELSLDADILAINFHQMLYIGAISNLFELLLFLMCGYFLLFMASGVIIKLRTWLRNSVNNKKKYIKRRNGVMKFLGTNCKKIHHRDRQLTDLVQRFGLVFVCFFTITSFLAWNEYEGNQKALRKKTDISNGHYQLVKTPLFKDKLIHLYCGSVNCAGYSETEGKVHYFPVKGITFEAEHFKKEAYLSVE